MEGCYGQSFHTISHSWVTWTHLAARIVGKCIPVSCVGGKGTSSLCCRYLPLPHVSEVADSTWNSIYLISHVFCSGMDIWPKLVQSHWTPDFCCDWMAYSFLMEISKDCSPMAAILRWDVGWGRCLRDWSQHPKAHPEMETEKPVSGHCLSCWIKSFLKPYLVFQRSQLVLYFCLIQFVL